MELRQFNAENECDIQDGISPASIVYVGKLLDVPENVIDDFGGYKKFHDALKTEDEDIIIFHVLTT